MPFQERHTNNLIETWRGGGVQRRAGSPSLDWNLCFVTTFVTGDQRCSSTACGLSAALTISGHVCGFVI